MEERLKAEMAEKEGLKRELNIEVPAEVVDQEFNKIYGEYSKKAKIKGFRPGKVPVKVIRSRFKNEATADVVDSLINKYFEEALKEKNIEPIGKPVLSSVDIDEGKPMSFTIGFEVLPDIDKVNYDEIRIDMPKIEVTDEEVDRVLNQMRKGSADIRSVDRPAEKSDIVICDLQVVAGDIETDDKILQNQEIDLDNEYTVKEFREGLVGVKRDDIPEIKIEYGDDYPDEKFAGKSITYKVKVNEIKERVLPLLNDDFAKQVGHGETLLELKLAIRKHVESEKKADAARIAKKSLIDQLVEKNQINVPESMVESYLNGVVEDYKKNEEKFDEAEIREKYRPVGQNAVRWYLLFHRLAEQEKIEVSTDDTENWIKNFADNYRMEVPQAKELLAKTGKASEIRDGILEEKVVDFLMTRAGHEGTLENKEGNQ
jgi:trigger factor